MQCVSNLKIKMYQIVLHLAYKIHLNTVELKLVVKLIERVCVKSGGAVEFLCGNMKTNYTAVVKR